MASRLTQPGHDSTVSWLLLHTQSLRRRVEHAQLSIRQINRVTKRTKDRSRIENAIDRLRKIWYHCGHDTSRNAITRLSKRKSVNACLLVRRDRRSTESTNQRRICFCHLQPRFRDNSATNNRSTCAGVYRKHKRTG